LKLLDFLLLYALLLVAMSAHEFSHGWVAYKLGDATAKNSGRLTLNPLKHIDPMGTLILPLLLFITTHGQFVFGAAKPVPINYRALRNPKKDIIWIGASGPLANFAFAFTLSLFLRILPAQTLLTHLIVNLIMINLLLAIFNLIPIPPLDGSRILIGLLPEKLSYSYASIEPYGFIILIALIALGVINAIVIPLLNFILGLMLLPF